MSHSSISWPTWARLPRSGSIVGTRCRDSWPGRSKITESHDEEPADAAPAPAEAVAERKEKLDDDIDAILEDIDDVLETNAEDFVKSFIQKGGQ